MENIMSKKTSTRNTSQALSLQSFKFISLTNLTEAESLALLCSLEMAGYLRSDGQPLITESSVNDFMDSNILEFLHNNKLVKFHAAPESALSGHKVGEVKMGAPQMDFTVLECCEVSIDGVTYVRK